MCWIVDGEGAYRYDGENKGNAPDEKDVDGRVDDHGGHEALGREKDGKGPGNVDARVRHG